VCQRVQLSDWSGIHEVLLPKPPKAELSVWESGVNAWFPLASKFFRVRGCPWGARPRAPGNDYVAAREGPSGLLQELGATGELRAFPGPLQEPGLGIFACGALPGPLHGSGPCKLDPTRRTSRLLGAATPRPRIPGKSRRAAAQGCLPRIPRFVCCRGPPLLLGTASRNNFKKSLLVGSSAPPTRTTSRLLGAATPRPRFQTSSCPRVFAEDPAFRLLSGSTPSTRHGVVVTRM
jgi:hypothetical protein